MKNNTLPSLFVIVSIIICFNACKEKTTNTKQSEVDIVSRKVQDLINSKKLNQEDKAIKDDSVLENQIVNSNFDSVISTIDKRMLPLVDETNFDSFLGEDDYQEVDVQALNLEKIYPNFYKEGYNYRAIASYKINLSNTFHSIVVTTLKGDHEMESIFINYDLSGNIIDHKVIAYDEIAEGMSRIECKIEQDKLTVNNIVMLEENVETIEIFELDSEGGIIPMTVNSATPGEINLVDSVIKQLGLNSSTIKTEFIVSKVQPNDLTKTIVVIPESLGDEDPHFFQLNSHILIVDNVTGIISNKYFESYMTNGWESDAIGLEKITVDTAPYMVTRDSRAFGVRLYFVGASHANPYTNKHISLFVASGDTLRKVLHNYDVMNYGGEWDTNCYGEFLDTRNTLHISKEETNGYFDILVKSKITEIKNDEDKNGDCEAKETITHETTVLKFDGKAYKE